MAEYKIEVTTGDITNAGTFDYIFVTLIGTAGKSERTELDNYGIDFTAGKVRTYTVKSKASLGKLLLVKVEKDPLFSLVDDEWFCSKIVVTTPEKEVIFFPCNRWVSRGELVELRGGKAMKVFEEEHPLLIEHRKKELILSSCVYQWTINVPGLPHMSNFKYNSRLPDEIRFTWSKHLEIHYTTIASFAEFKFKGMIESTEDWENIEDIKKVFLSHTTPTAEYVTEHWKEDEFYGYQFLNGSNPNVIQRCLKLPSNFPVTEEMVKPFLQKGSSLKKEMEKGNIFLCDYKRMDGLPTRICNGKPLPLTAGLGLFYMNPDNKLMPIAIQLYQQPSEQNPIFLPSDSESDWMLAKLFLKNADAMLHEAIYHLMNTHYLAEGFTVATVRSFPAIHPLYKLLIPHFRYTIQVIIDGRPKLIGPKGALSQCSLGTEGLNEIMRRALSEMTYSSLCLPEDIAARGLESVPNFYYRDDGLKLWSIINSFAKAMVEYYYPSDSDVRKDSELQAWINEIYIHSFLANKNSGIPTSFQTVEELIKFITMLIFRVTAKHASVNNGQYDYSWIPSCPLMTRKAPPKTKGQSSMKTLFETMPNVGETAIFLAMALLLTYKYTDVVPMGSYPVERFDEPAPKKIIKEFQEKLAQLSEAIEKRNSKLALAYNYLDPALMENSIAI
ncbi:hydroperoxide isomerase ALOXE3-like [Centroberyx gerrardi]|uniref:hydroperoxide isomerase ALOXE3-like n=1 Tax=Centroberyx gerrardi TaxID=166262 RepID=UPI003AACAAE9